MGVLRNAHSHPQTGPLRYCAACDAPTGTNQPYRLRTGCVHWTIGIQNGRFCMFYACAYLQKAPAWNWRDARLRVACLEWAAALMWTRIPGALQELVRAQFAFPCAPDSPLTERAASNPSMPASHEPCPGHSQAACASSSRAWPLFASDEEMGGCLNASLHGHAPLSPRVGIRLRANRGIERGSNTD